MKIITWFKIAVPIFLAYLALSNNLAWNNVAVGAVVTVVVMLLIRPKLEPITPAQMFRSFMKLLVYIVVVAWDVLINGIVVARIVISPNVSIRPGVIAVDSQTRSPLLQAVSAHAITISPGEMVMEMDKSGRLYTHCLNIDRSAPQVAAAQRRRLELVADVF